jgi:hypothetical protein
VTREERARLAEERMDELMKRRADHL